MPIYTISVITSTGYPYYHLKIKSLPKGIKLFLRFFDFTRNNATDEPEIDSESSFQLNAGLISALFEFAKNMNKKINALAFKSKSEDHEGYNLSKKSYRGNVLITTQTETYLLHKSVRQKIKLIYDNVISLKIPLDTAPAISKNEEEQIINILTDVQARKHVENTSQNIRLSANTFFNEMKDYGLEAIVITSFDLSPIIVFGEKYSYKDIEVMLRNVGEIPIIEPLEWKYRQSFLKDSQAWVYIINSGVGVTVNGLFEPYFYLLIAEPQSYLGEFPATITSEFNVILG